MARETAFLTRACHTTSNTMSVLRIEIEISFMYLHLPVFGKNEPSFRNIK
jgi:hypothetical protein